MYSSERFTFAENSPDLGAKFVVLRRISFLDGLDYKPF
jgi:hypothetical protein